MPCHAHPTTTRAINTYAQPADGQRKDPNGGESGPEAKYYSARQSDRASCSHTKRQQVSKCSNTRSLSIESLWHACQHILRRQMHVLFLFLPAFLILVVPVIIDDLLNLGICPVFRFIVFRCSCNFVRPHFFRRCCRQRPFAPAARCPHSISALLSAIRPAMVNGKPTLEVDEKKCICCGACFPPCPPMQINDPEH